MNLRPKRTDEPEINLTPLIDTVLMLMIFFMVSTTFKDQVRMEVKLPAAQGDAAQTEAPKLLEVVIDSEGHFYVNQEQVVDRSVATLKRALSGALAARDGGHAGGAGATPGLAMLGAEAPAPDLPVLIKADARTPHQAVMTAMDAVSQLGLARIAFAATQPEPGDAP